mmetsp:Transcript_7763/g.7007  ORF Transcript_7763/g.7007 Transcript_7763/m.7007 type:complete len:95 (+) Transcript_7763:650-934(+)
MCDGTGISSASIDGRCNLSYLGQDNQGLPKLNNILTFKAHKVDNAHNNQNMLFPVHAVGFHPKVKNFLYTAGGDGNLYFWDFGAKNKIKGFNFS